MNTGRVGKEQQMNWLQLVRVYQINQKIIKMTSERDKILQELYQEYGKTLTEEFYCQMETGNYK